MPPAYTEQFPQKLQLEKFSEMISKYLIFLTKKMAN